MWCKVWALRCPRPWWRRFFPVLLPNLGGPFLTFRDHRIEFAIVQQQSNPQDSPADLDHQSVMFPTRHAPNVPAELPAQSAGRPAPGPQVLVVQQPNNPRDLATDFDHHVVLFPTRYAAYVPAGFPAQSASGPAFGVLPTADGGNVIWAVR